MALGEMSRTDFFDFLMEGSGTAAQFSRERAVHFVCMDWRHLGELIEAGHEVYGDMLNLVIWVETNAGQGSFYRSQHELIGVFRVGKAHTSIISNSAGTADHALTSGITPA